VPPQEKIRLTIWTWPNAITQQKPASLYFTWESESQTLIIRPLKKIAVLKLGEAYRWLPSAANAKLHPVGLSKTSAWIAAPEVYGHKFLSFQFSRVHDADLHRRIGFGSYHNNRR